MGVNRIVMQNGVVWWLPPLRARDEAERAPPRPACRPRRDGSRRDPSRAARDASATPPAGFVPLSSLGIPGLDSILFSHADFYREAYDRAVRDRQEGDAGPPRADPAAAEPMPGPDEGPGLEGDGGRREW
ncbi:MAG: hypothetical protein RLZZ326_838 [Planctomycetota bacterium]|jgi:hypothetical protein